MFTKKKLTLREIHQLYLSLKDSLPEKEEDLLIDEIEKIMNKIDSISLTNSLKLLKKDFSNKNGIEILTIFIEALKEVKFFEYLYFIQELNGRRSS